MKKTWLILIGIIIVAALLRLFALGNIPASPDWDEAALGYNAYSILHTGKDEYGTVLPLTLRSFNDYKPGLYAYFIIPFLLLFDLSLIAVRLPSALFGILTMIGVFFLVKDLFKNTNLALLSAFLLAISPWHIQFSRAAFEANVGLAFIVFTVLFFIKGLTGPWLLSVAGVFAVLNLYMYQGEKAFMPLVILLLVGIFWRELLRLPRKYLVTACVVGIVIALPFVISVFSGEAFARASGTSIIQRRTADTERYEQRVAYSAEHNLPFGLIMNNRRIVYGKEVLAGYLSHYNLNWLFITGDNPRHHAPNMGLLYLWELPFLLVGIYALIFYKRGNQRFLKEKLLVFGWLIISPLPAAATIDTPHAVRTLSMLPVIELFVASGLLSSYIFLKQKKQFALLGISIAGVILVGVFSFFYYLDQYFVQYNYVTGSDWQYGYMDVVSYIDSHKNDYNKIVISNMAPLDQSYIFFLYYLRYPPEKYQQEVQRFLDKGDIRGFDEYEFRPLSVSNEHHEENTLYVTNGYERLPDQARKVHEVLYKNGDPAFQAFTF